MNNTQFQDLKLITSSSNHHDHHLHHSSLKEYIRTIYTILAIIFRVVVSINPAPLNNQIWWRPQSSWQSDSINSASVTISPIVDFTHIFVTFFLLEINRYLVPSVRGSGFHHRKSWMVLIVQQWAPCISFSQENPRLGKLEFIHFSRLDLGPSILLMLRLPTLDLFLMIYNVVI